MTSLTIPAAGRKPGNVGVYFSFCVLGLIMLAIALTPVFAADATKQNILENLLPPGSEGHLLGTDELGRDVLQLTVAGTGSAMIGPICIAVGSMVIGIVLGTLAGYYRGGIDFGISRMTDLFLSLPVMLLAIVVAGVFNSGYWATVILLAVLFSPSDIRIVRSGILDQSTRPYVEAAQMLSLPQWKIMFRHLLPNIWPLVITNLLLNMAIALVTLSSLSFLGVGVRPGTADWGRQISDGRAIMFDNPAAVIVPALCIILAACAINVIGDWVGERLRKQGIQ